MPTPAPFANLHDIVTAGQSTGMVAPTAQPTSSNAIPYWGYYGSQNYFDQDPTQGAPGQQFLAALQKYDPNARFNQTTMGESGSPVWTLQYDASKLPGGRTLGGGNVDLNPGDYAPQYYSIGDAGGFDPARSPNGGDFKGQLYYPNAVINDPVYGRTTPQWNVKQPSSLLDTLGPAAVMLFGMLTGGALPFLQQLLLKAPNTIGGILNNQRGG